MRVGAVSGDLVIKLALAAGALALAWYLYRQTAGRLASAADAVSGTVSDLVDAAADVADSVIVGVNPANPSNWVNQGVTAIGSAVVADDGAGRNADGSWTVGGWLYDVTHPGWADNLSGPTPEPVPPAAPPQPTGGAAFGWFPQLGRGTQSAVQTIATRGRVVGGL